jgi:hypothetical protein
MYWNLCYVYTGLNCLVFALLVGDQQPDLDNAFYFCVILHELKP